MSSVVTESPVSPIEQQDLLQRRVNFGRDVIGPVVARFLYKLHATARTFETTSGTRVLFCSRAGVRIRRLLEIATERLGLAPLSTGRDLWISRLLAAKGAWKNAPHDVRRFLDYEFHVRTHEEFVSAMLRATPDLAAKAVQACRSPDSVGGIDGFLQSDDPAARMVREYFDEQGELFQRHVWDAMGAGTHATLVDTGWQGTTQRFLSNACPDIDFWGLYFGRAGFEDTDRTGWEKMIGLAFETDTFERDQLTSAVLFHRHMIESVFEPNAGSIEHLEQNADGKVVVPGAQAILDDPHEPHSDPFYTGIREHLEALSPADTLASIERAANVAERKLAEFIMLPTAEDAALYLSTDRSADVGRTFRVPVLLPAEDRNEDDSCNRRIDDALWQPGQIALEFPAETARPLQRRKTGLSRKELDVPARKPARRKRTTKPKVAVITRTMDRPMFLRRALISVSKQTFTDYVHVVVNDGGNNEVIRQTIEDAPIDRSRVVLVNNVENRGMEAASNFAIGSCDSEYIVIHDDDDTWKPEFLETTVSMLDSSDGQRYVGVITASDYVSEEVTPDGIEVHATAPFMGWVDRVDLMEMSIGNFFPPIAFLFRRSAYTSVGGFNEYYPVLGDWDFNLQVLTLGDIAMVNRSLANYHHRDRGDPKLFGNSVIADRDKHAYYNTAVRNDFIRSAMKSGNPALAQLVGLGTPLAELRSNGRTALSHLHDLAVSRKAALRSPTSGADHPSDESLEISAELYWRALHSLHTRMRAGSVRAFAMSLKGLAWRAAGTILRRKLQAGPLSVNQIKALASTASPGSVKRPDFPEERYLKKNPDVAEAVHSGALPSGYYHFINHGIHEGRSY